MKRIILAGVCVATTVALWPAAWSLTGRVYGVGPAGQIPATLVVLGVVALPAYLWLRQLHQYPRRVVRTVLDLIPAAEPSALEGRVVVQSMTVTDLPVAEIGAR